ncbi:alpha/beta hydrolase [Candidatus Symbiopectobacterium sp. NZEC151]|uniref:alpha/beta hydrolase n=2 Tax=unclassified Symbiopectobacterium TaxID=2794573 RepID=UPI002228060C|nr:alpha/beta hydrolase-fold protein [Candidatus Symbiopectobacterium sp. NZEC151]MCW2477379.1 alpha/beta hydrolase [Candidatus Symbiopectobacterium sp. NZEC151]
MRYLPVVLITLIASSLLPARAQPPVATLSENAKRYFSIEQHDMESTRQLQYRIFIATPRDIAAQEKRPVLYVLDANAQFPLAVNSYTPAQGPAPVIVGIGYRIDQGYDIPARTRDYTPPAPTPDPDFGAGGEAELFYQFIQHSVKPWVETQAPVNPQQQTLAGHSFGGLFVLYTLFNHGESFQRYLAASPSIWWGDGVVIPKRSPLLTAQPTSITISVGEYEEKPPKADPNQPVDPKRAKRQAQRTMVTKARDLAAQLHTENPAASFILFEGKHHGSVIPDAMAKAVEVTIQPQ